MFSCLWIYNYMATTNKDTSGIKEVVYTWPRKQQWLYKRTDMTGPTGQDLYKKLAGGYAYS